MGAFKETLGDELFSWADRKPTFDGQTYEPARDHKRLGKQYLRTWNCMKDGQWRTLEQISKETGDPQASISARMRDFRKSKFGGHSVERKHIDSGLFAYRLLVS